jgi:SAM-dependent methyltransferase
MRREDYQNDFSKLHPKMYNRVLYGKTGPRVITILSDYFSSEGKSLSELSLLDIGCSTGFLTGIYAGVFRTVVAVDIDEGALEFAEKHNNADNITYRMGDGMKTDFPSSSFDVVTCTKVYEHVPDADVLMAEIHRLLKAGGICYFSAENRFRVIEPHYHLPFLSIFPRPIAHLYLRIAGRGSFYYEKPLTLWGLRRLVRRFEIIDYTIKVIREPERFNADDMLVLGTIKQRLSLFILSIAYFLSPVYLWLLKKKRELE